MKRTIIQQLLLNPKSYYNTEIKLCGWVKTIRNSKDISFMEINDGTTFKNIQGILEKAITESYEEVSKLNTGTSICLCGTVVPTPEAKQDFEVKVKSIAVEGTCDESYPLQKKRHSFEYLRSISHLRPRTNTLSAVFRVRSILAFAIHSFFQERGFIYVNTPIITASDCEGAGEMFRVTTLDKGDKSDSSKDFFGTETGLTVSGQLESEAFCLAYDRVYTFGPTFRAENSNTARHASEFWMVEPEIAFSDLNDDMNLAEDMMKYIISYVLKKAPNEMEFFNKFIDKNLFEKLNNILNSKFERITYTKAIQILHEADHEFENLPEWGEDLKTEHERYLTEKKYNKPVFVTDYPKDIKAFYMRINDDLKTVAAMDLLVPGVGEIIGGSQREERLEVLEKRMLDAGMDLENYEWYLDLRKYGCTKHAGFGLGFERAVMYITGMTNIRDVIPFSRTPGNAEF